MDTLRNFLSSKGGATLSLGSRGEPVGALEREMQRRGYYKGPIDNRYGTGLRAAVKKYQTDQSHNSHGVDSNGLYGGGLTPDGKVGWKTIDLLSQDRPNATSPGEDVETKGRGTYQPGGNDTTLSTSNFGTAGPSATIEDPRHNTTVTGTGTGTTTLTPTAPGADLTLRADPKDPKLAGTGQDISVDGGTGQVKTTPVGTNMDVTANGTDIVQTTPGKDLKHPATSSTIETREPGPMESLFGSPPHGQKFTAPNGSSYTWDPETGQYKDDKGQVYLDRGLSYRIDQGMIDQEKTREEVTKPLFDPNASIWEKLTASAAAASMSPY